MIPLNMIDLTGLAVGQTATLDLSPVGAGAGGVSANPVMLNQSAYLYLFNESGAGLYGEYQPSKQGFNLPAGAWIPKAIPPGQSSVIFTVLYTINNPGVSKLLADYYDPGEPIPTIALGNSPIGGTTVSSIANQVQNFGNVAGSYVVQADPNNGIAGPWDTTIFNNGGEILGASTTGGPGGASGQLMINLGSVLVSGTPPTGTGSVSVYQVMGAAQPYMGSSASLCYKKLFIVYSNYKNTSVSKWTLALPAAMKCQNAWYVQTTDAPSLEFLSSGFAQSLNVVSTIGNFNAVSSIGGFIWGAGIGVFDTFRFGANDASAHNGVTILEYI